MKDIKIADKKFLNDRADEYGSVAWYVEVGAHQFDREDKVKHIPRCASLRIADCHDDIALDFYHRSKED